MFDISEVLRASSTHKASDVYIKVGISPRMRKEGKLAEMDFPAILSGDILDLVLKLLDEEKRDVLEEKGEYCFSYHHPLAGRYRVSIYKSSDAISMVFHKVWSVSEIADGFSVPKVVGALAAAEKGLIVFAGNRGSGKTTAMAYLVDEINANYPVHIVTMENPIEVIHSSKIALVDQREAGTDYAEVGSGLKYVEKQSADMLVYADVISNATFEQICRIAESGNRVLLEAAGNSLSEVIEGFTNLFPVNEQNQIRKRISRILQAVVITRQIRGEEFAQEYEVIRVDDGVRNRICYGK